MTTRRELMKLAALGGGAVYLSGLPGYAASPAQTRAGAPNDDFYFVQLSDTHWGFSGPPNPDASNTLRKAVATVNALETPQAHGGFPRDRVGVEGEAGALHAR